MRNWLAKSILKYRLPLLVSLFAFTGFMAYKGKQVQWSYDFMRIVPDDDPDMVYFNKFTETFGEDANMLAIGLKDSAVYQLANFKELVKFTEATSKIEGINQTVSLANIQYLVSNREEKKFEAYPVFPDELNNQTELDSLLDFAKKLKFYEGKLINPENGATVLLVSLDAEYLNSARRMDVVGEVSRLGETFSKNTGITLHYAGLPYVRTEMVGKVRSELNMFLLISIGITAVILFLFFRSFSPVIYPLVIIGMIIVWTMGTLALFEYKITMLTGLLPPILVVIGIPNCIYLLNKYHQEYAKSKDKLKALANMIQKIGIVTLITNTTTAIGFFVLTFTHIDPLKEFGLVASLNILGTFVISIILIPAVFSYLPAPAPRHVRHLKFRFIEWVLALFDRLITRHSAYVYAVSIVLIVIASYGAMQVKALTYMVDDLPEGSQILKDLAFFEDNFEGVMPLEVIVDTGIEKGVRKDTNLKKIEELEQYFTELPDVTTPISMVTFLKAANQAFFNNNPLDYSLPNRRDGLLIQRYLRNESDSGNQALAFVDSTERYMRLSMKVADLGSYKLDTLINQKIRPKIQEVLKDTELKAEVTGTTLIFIRGNEYLINNLRTSMLLAFLLIALIMATLFGNLRIILISLIPNVLPLLITAGLMGYLGIPLKPSTALVFSIAFGISVDDSIHFLAKYRQELMMNNYNILEGVSISLKETGMSMIYTSIVLFFGFVIFVASDFGGTVALGALTSTTLLVAMITNLILLPCLIRSFDKKSKLLEARIESKQKKLEATRQDTDKPV